MHTIAHPLSPSPPLTNAEAHPRRAPHLTSALTTTCLQFRKHGKLVLELSWNLSILNDLGAMTLSPVVTYQTGMDVVLERRALNHLKRMRTRNLPMSTAFHDLAESWTSSLSDSEGEWVAPTSDLSQLGVPSRERGSPSGATPDKEEEAALGAVADTQRRRGEGTRWNGRMRGVL